MVIVEKFEIMYFLTMMVWMTEDELFMNGMYKAMECSENEISEMLAEIRAGVPKKENNSVVN